MCVGGREEGESRTARSSVQKNAQSQGGQQRGGTQQQPGGGRTHVMHGHNRMAKDPRIPTYAGTELGGKSSPPPSEIRYAPVSVFNFIPCAYIGLSYYEWL